MAWKTEQWMRDIFPGADKIYSEYHQLPRRELAVVAGAVLDAALAELLAKRLNGPEKEIHSFLGLDGDGRAPCGSFGARIQLAQLTSLISAKDAAILRAIKKIRNLFAHEVRSDFNSELVLPNIIKLNDLFLSQENYLIDSGLVRGSSRSSESIRPHLETTPEAGAGLLLVVFSVYQAYFHRLYELIQPIAKLPLSQEK